MSDDWDFYAAKVDEKPASIFVDLGIAKSAPLAPYSAMAYVRIYMNRPREDGLSSQDEFETLCELEDGMVPALTADNDAAVYVGRNTSDGCRDFYFYTSDAKHWEAAVKEAMSFSAAYRLDSGVRDDPDWEAYFQFLYPSPADWQAIQNRRVVENLEKHGDKLEQEREIDHWAYFPQPIQGISLSFK